ncbi:entry exclusion lipoprotein TrbK [Xanthomonas translucens]|uniref:entry exclusion lipoprotein TrbK n=1 Tax=Xanthomonas campestris pv. translucens TaxID=343 RepID=UPI00071E8A73|nr:entry exclusion lipoprotein TrbK [Xanthomonas translucens]QSQ62194.1 entry exclusion lipoprotein TrbK [Xanthomonas translucens pv. undulosa]UKE41820.1 entry exclusion lipoprotein TrbK [Xanthomonas translucens pv. undulosa]UPU47173.1 entry exclusion lipoprotein TrbK [Xanthomonas translucens pv. undulosa]UPU47207.1 entry exclusion lipoprotein TrbK [Xanthomonas translucens pv. undulosa]
MKAIKALSLASAALVAALVTGCDNKPATVTMPEVNDVNCKPENIAKITDKGVQQSFSSQCLRRIGDFKPSPKREW